MEIRVEQPAEVLTNGEVILNLLLLRVSRPIPTREPPHPPHDIILRDIESLRQIIELYKTNKNLNKKLQFSTDRVTLTLNAERLVNQLSELNTQFREKYKFGPDELEYGKIMSSMINMLVECSENRKQINKQNRDAVIIVGQGCDKIKTDLELLRDMIAVETYDRTSIYRWYNYAIIASQCGRFAFENSTETNPDIFNRDYKIFEAQRQDEYMRRDHLLRTTNSFTYSLGGKPRKNKKQSRHRGRRSGRKSRSTSTRTHRSRKY